MCTRRRVLPKIGARFPCIASVSAEEQAGRQSACEGCPCKESKTTCPLHVLGPWLEDCTDGSPLFPSVTAAGALRVLRTMLADLSFPHAAEYRTHDFRRGHAKDLQVSGRRLCCIFGFSVDHMANLFSEEHSSGRYWKQGNGGHLLS